MNKPKAHPDCNSSDGSSDYKLNYPTKSMSSPMPFIPKLDLNGIRIDTHRPKTDRDVILESCSSSSFDSDSDLNKLGSDCELNDIDLAFHNDLNEPPFFIKKREYKDHQLTQLASYKNEIELSDDYRFAAKDDQHIKNPTLYTLIEQGQGLGKSHSCKEVFRNVNLISPKVGKVDVVHPMPPVGKTLDKFKMKFAEKLDDFSDVLLSPKVITNQTDVVKSSTIKGTVVLYYKTHYDSYGNKTAYFYYESPTGGEIFHGRYFYHNKHGIPVVGCNYRYGMLHGKYMEFYDTKISPKHDGTLPKVITKIDCSYKYNVYHGLYKEYYRDGVLRFEATYNLGKKYGQFKEYNPYGHHKYSIAFTFFHFSKYH